jgi:hypothetical protein
MWDKSGASKHLGGYAPSPKAATAVGFWSHRGGYPAGFTSPMPSKHQFRALFTLASRWGHIAYAINTAGPPRILT